MAERPFITLAMVPFFNQQLFNETHWQRLAACAELASRDPITAFEDPQAKEWLARTDILLTGWGCPLIDEHVLRAAPRLSAIVHAAGTVKQHILPECWDAGIRVSAAAAANAVPVAEYTVAAILFANKRVLRLQQRYREARDFRFWAAEFPDLGNYCKKIGIVGASHIGRLVAERLRMFDLDLLLSDPFVDVAGARALGAELVELDELMRRADVVTLHAPALPETRHMIDARRLALLRDGATLINTARGWLVDHAALEAELVRGRIDAILDTTEPETLPSSSPLYDLPNVFLTPHIAGSMGTETERMGELAVAEIERLTRGEPLRHEIHRADLERIA